MEGILQSTMSISIEIGSTHLPGYGYVRKSGV